MISLRKLFSKRRTLIVAIFLPSALFTSQNAIAAHGYDVWGFGTSSCGEFIETYSAHKRGENAATFNLAITWMQGFLTAEEAEWMAPIAKKIGPENVKPEMHLLYGLDIEALAAWMNSYCSAHPLNHLSDAAVSLTVTLIDRAAKRTQ